MIILCVLCAQVKYIDSYTLLSRDDDVFPGMSKVLQRLHTVLFMLGSLETNQTHEIEGTNYTIYGLCNNNPV